MFQREETEERIMGCVGCLRVTPVGEKREQKRCRGAEGGRRVAALRGTEVKGSRGAH